MRGNDLNPKASSTQASCSGHAVDCVIAVRGIVVKQRYRLCPGSASDLDRILRRGMAPIAFRGELFQRVLRIMDEQVNTVRKFKHLLGHVETAVRWLLVIGNERKGPAATGKAVARGGAHMGDRTRSHGNGADVESVAVDLVERELAEEVGQMNGKIRRPNPLLERLREGQADG